MARLCAWRTAGVELVGVQGVPVVGATVLLWVVKLAVLGVLLYSAFWLALLLVCVVAVGWAANQSHSDEEFHLQFPTTLKNFERHRVMTRISTTTHLMRCTRMMTDTRLERASLQLP